jgi:hypothetical protein
MDAHSKSQSSMLPSILEQSTWLGQNLPKVCLLHRANFSVPLLSGI